MLRIRLRAQLQRVMAERPVARTTHFALHRLQQDLELPVHSPSSLVPAPRMWLGAVVPKRWARRAVTRNAIKRQIYQLAGQIAWPAPPVAQVVRLRAGFAKAQFPSGSSDALKRAVRLELMQLLGAPVCLGPSTAGNPPQPAEPDLAATP